MPTWLISAASWLFTTETGQQLLWTILGLVGVQQWFKSKQVQAFLPLAEQIFKLVESWASRQPEKLTGKQKRDVAMGQLAFLAKANGITLTAALKKQADALWAQLGWAVKAAGGVP